MTKRYEELTFADDFMFCRVLEDSPGLCRELLSLILDRPVGELVSVNRQKPIEIKADSRVVLPEPGDDIRLTSRSFLMKGSTFLCALHDTFFILR